MRREGWGVCVDEEAGCDERGATPCRGAMRPERVLAPAPPQLGTREPQRAAEGLTPMMGAQLAWPP